MRKIFLLAFIIFSFSLSAQENSGDKSEAVKLIELTSKSIFADLINQLGAGVPEANKEAFTTEANSTLTNLMNELAEVYMQEFTNEEIKEIIAFYETPTGKKSAEKAMPIMQKTMSIGQSWGMEIQQIAQKYSN